MEVHAHPHTADHASHRGRKKWTHYFWEFFMLFLAVTLGFFVENQREHMVEHHREKQFMESMIEDLASDTVSLTPAIIRAAAMQNGLDSLKNYLYDIENVEKNTSVIYRQNATYTRNILLSLNDQTSTQLRNAGGMRLIRNKDVANAIARYWKFSIILENTVNNFNAFMADKAGSEDLIFNRKFYNMLARVDSTTTLSIYSDNPEARLMTTDKSQLISYANFTDRLQKFIEQYIIPQVNRFKSRTKELLDLIKKSYRLK